MPFTPGDQAEPLIERLVTMYSAAEADLLAKLAARVAKGLGSPHWIEQQVLEMARWRKQCEQVLERLRTHGAAAVSDTLGMAANRGQAGAIADLAEALQRPVAEVAGFGAGAIDQYAMLNLAQDLTGKLAGMRWPILRSAQDAYRQVIADVAYRVPTGTVSRRQVAQDALDRFAQKGVTGFVDRSGRQWQMSSYVEMATRASTMNAAIQGHLDRLQANGMNLVIVSDVPQECRRCARWEGKVLTIASGAGGVIGAIDDGQPVKIEGSVEQARADGLFHPGCRHSLSVYIPGVTRSFGHTADPEGDAARQKLRYLERQVRASKRAELVALDEPAKKAAQARARAYQAQIRDHVATTSAKRQPHRERITGEYKPIGLITAASKKAPKPTTVTPIAQGKHNATPSAIDSLKDIDLKPHDLSTAAGRYAFANDNVVRANPNFKPKTPTGVNCQRCVQALEVRDRGYAATAAPNFNPDPKTDPAKWSTQIGTTEDQYTKMKSGTLAKDWFLDSDGWDDKLRAKINLAHVADLWRQKDGSVRQFTVQPKDQLLKSLEAMPVGARGWVDIWWYNDAAHIFSWRVLEDSATGKKVLSFVDPQTGRVDVAHYLDLTKKTPTGDDHPEALAWLRVDDLEPTDDVLEYVEPE
jgi:hypothetical protein